MRNTSNNQIGNASSGRQSRRYRKLAVLSIAIVAIVCLRWAERSISANGATTLQKRHGGAPASSRAGALSRLPARTRAHPFSEEGRIDFNRDIRPILSDKCFACHGPDAPNKKIELRLDSEAAARAELGRGRHAVVPGHPEESQLVKRITAKDEAMRMPPADSGKTLAQAQIELLSEWIRQGAEWQRHWSFVPPVRPELPQVKDAAWPRNAIDYFALSRLEREGLQPAPEADRATLIRRVSLDLTGLPPAPKEIDDFLNDKSPSAYEKVVDRLLTSPRYGERMAFRWLDAARYADTNGYQFDGERQMWRWRDWVIEAFNRNLPYDRFVVEQLAGDLLPNPTMEQRLATGFNRNHRGNTEDGLIPEEYAVEYVIDRVDTTATVFLGLTVGCARCHNHKYDPITQQEFYQLYAYFNSIPENGRAVRDSNSPPLVRAPTAEQQRQLRQLEAQIAESENFLARNEARIQTAQRKWERALKAEAPATEHWFPNDGLVAHFPLDEVGQDAILSHDQSKADLKDRSPQYQPGSVNRAAAFNGQTMLNAGKLANFDVTDSFALSAWIYPMAESGGPILTHADAVGGGETKSPGAQIGKGYGLSLNDGKLHFNLVSVWADDAIRVETESGPTPNQWHQVLASYDGTYLADGVRIYLDGQLQKLKVNYKQIFRPFAVNQPLLIGGSNDAKAPRFRGMIDEVRIYDGIPTPAQVAALANAETLSAIARSSARNETQAQKLRWAFLDRAAPPEIQQTWRRVNELKQQSAKLEKSFPTAMVMQELDAPRPAFRLKRGAYDAPAEQVKRGVPAALPPLPAGAPNNRLGLARWLTAPQHPLTARVAVNRFWQMFFGLGIVKTSEDFGAQGDQPSHPGLLDWLAVEFMTKDEGGRMKDESTRSLHPSSFISHPSKSTWDVKALLRTIVMSATYRQSSKASAALIAKDPANRLLARGPRLRLPAEMIRDQALFASGLLVEQLGGPSVKPYQPEGLWDDLVIVNPNVPVQKYAQDRGEKLYRRTLYTYWKRTIAPPFMLNFDGAGRETCVVREHRTNTPLQALNLMNDMTYVEAARMLAERALREGGATAEARISYAFRLATGRLPNERETRILLGNLRAQLDEFRADPAKAAQLLSIGEKKADPKLDANELAAYATVASLIFNLDEVITKE